MPVHVKALILFVAHETIMIMGTVGGLHVVLPTITEEFNTTIATTVWIMLAYSLALAGGTFALGKSSTLLEKRMLITLGLVVDIGLLVAIFYTHNIYFFIAARFFSAFIRIYPWLILQVLGIGGFPVEHRGRVLGITGVVSGLAMMAAVPLSGFVTQLWGWRWLFMGTSWAFALMTVAVWLMLPKLGPSTNAPKIKLSQFDIPGSALMMVGMVTLLASLQFFVRGYAPNMAVVMLIFALVGLGAFVWVETHTKTPIVPFAIFKVRGVMIGAVQAVTLGWMTASLQLLLSFLFIVGFGWSVAYAASIMFFMGVVMPISRFVAGWASDRYGSSGVVILTGIVAVIGQFIISAEGTSPNLSFIIGALILIGLGQAAMQTANQRQIFTSIPKNQLHLAPSVSLVLSTSGQSIGLAFVAATLVSGVSMASGTGIVNTEMIATASSAIRVVTVILVVGLAVAQIVPRLYGSGTIGNTSNLSGVPQ
jgi:MFS family permease